jgi:hypothetical protein
VSSDPFRDVIKTEPAPDLPSLISDMMMPYLGEHGVTTAKVVLEDEVKPPVEPNRLLGQHQPSNFSANSVSITNPSFPATTASAEPDEDGSLFSLDSVLDLFFNEPTPVNVESNKTTTRLVGTHQSASRPTTPAGRGTEPSKRTTTTTAASTVATTTPTTIATTTTTTTAPTTRRRRARRMSQRPERVALSSNSPVATSTGVCIASVESSWSYQIRASSVDAPKLACSASHSTAKYRS